MDEQKKSRRGFASMTPERRVEVSSLGGKSSAPEKRAFKNRDLARRAAKTRWSNKRAKAQTGVQDG